MDQEVDKIYKKLSKWKSKLHDYQQHCKHIGASKEFRSNTGNYDPSEDCYWIDWHCLNCDKKWSTDQ